MKTPLYESQLQKNGKFISFAGFQLPLSYSSILEEYSAVRNGVALFDISHMGIIQIIGKDTLAFLDHLSTQKVTDKPFGKALYTLFCNTDGGVIDDLLIYLISDQAAQLVVNGINRQEVLHHLLSLCRGFEVEIYPKYETHGILSLQGPLSSELLKTIYPEVENLKKMEFFSPPNGIIAKTGYTGELGFELFLENEALVATWERLIKQGEKFSLKLAGLGCRDILRQEMGYALYGHELSKEICPIESVAAWAVHLDHEFIGKDAILKKLKNQDFRFAKGLIGKEAIPAREGYKIFHEGKEVGAVTSGTFSPYLKKPIALSLLNLNLPEDSGVEIEIRDKLYPFTITHIPFYRRKS